ncbi:MAG: hypothetical protein II480_06050, partial [Bacteroidales bacterium]|nr:hypothetical protein [Bacteroidales bacterium]
MKAKFLIAAAAISILAACGQSSTQNSNNQNDNQANKPLQEVQGRKNFGGQHPVITPLPCIMIATYDQKQNPD